MGGTESKSTVEILNSISIDVVQQAISRCVQSATQQQLISARNVAGDVTIEGTSMKQGSTVNMSCAMSASMQSDIQQKVANAIAQYAETEGVALLSALGSTRSEAATNIASIFSTRVEQTTLQENVQQTLNSQTIEATDIGGKLVIRNTTMEQTISMVADAIINSSGYSSAISEIANKIDQTTKAKETGPLDTFFSMVGGLFSSWVMMVVGIIVVAGLCFIFFAKYLFTTDNGALLINKGAELGQQALAKQGGPSFS